VLHVIDSLAVGGAERMLVELVNNLDPAVVNPVVCVTRNDMTLAGTLKDSIEVHRLQRKSTWDASGLRKFGEIVRKSEIDVIHAHGYSSSHFVAAAKGLNLLSLPFIMHAHDSEFPGMSTRVISKLTIDHFIGVAPEIAEWAASYLRLPMKRITFLGNALDFSAYAAPTPLDVSPYFKPRPKFLGIVIANVRRVKDFEVMLRAVALSRFRNEIGILVAGSLADKDYVAQCLQLIRELGLSESVVFLGISREIPELLAAADFGLLSSDKESGPLALLEYMASALPFVATQVGHIGQSAASAGLSGLVPKGDPLQFSNALDELLQLTTSQQRARGISGKTFALRQFDIKERATRLQELYTSLLNERAGTKWQGNGVD
jgi:glycosyltransferase involved in cell wall biosynthesis